MAKLGLFIQGLLILLVLSSPFWLDWKLVVVGIILYFLQLIFFKEDLMTKTNFKTKERGQMTFYSFILEELGIFISRKRIQMIADYLLPWALFGFAYFWQEVLNKSILIRIY